MKEKFALIIPAYGQFDYVALCLKSLARYTSDYRCIVIDDGSPDWDEAWLAEFRKLIPADRFYFERFETNRGPTAAWNRGLELARQFQNEFAVIVNSDTLFSPGWMLRTQQALENIDLVGPMSNAPGEHVQQQIQKRLSGYRLDDSHDALVAMAHKLKRKFGGLIKPGIINGFWMAAKTATWWQNAFDAAHVFDPKNRVTGNETEFQKRFKGKIGAAQDIFIFHYRSVSRGLENVEPEYCQGAFRPAGLSASAAIKKSAFNGSYVSRRSELVAFIPHSVQRVLDVGCSVGALGTTLKARQKVYVAGVEYDPEMAGVAASVLDHVIKGDAENVSVAELTRGELFDCIIFADVLEHLRDPWTTIAKYSSVLKPGGYVVASLPNIRHFTSILNLAVKGYWPHRDRGIHDRTHLRWFTRRNIEELFEFANLEIREWQPVYRIIEHPHDWNRFAPCFAIPPFRDLLTFQYYVLAQK